MTFFVGFLPAQQEQAAQQRGDGSDSSPPSAKHGRTSSSGSLWGVQRGSSAALDMLRASSSESIIGAHAPLDALPNQAFLGFGVSEHI